MTETIGLSIAIVRLSAFGDIIHSMSVCAKLKRALNCKITWITNESFKEVANHSPYIDEVIAVKKLRFPTILSDIKEIENRFENMDKDFDLIIDMQGLMKSALVGFILKNSMKKKVDLVGFNSLSAREKMAPFLYTKSYDIPYFSHILERNKRVVELALDIKLDDKVDDIFLGFSTKPKANSRKIALIFEASKDNKMINLELAKFILKTIEKNSAFEVDIIHNTDEDLANKIAQNSKIAKVAPKMSIDELKAFLSKKKLVIGGDTGPTHVAFGLGIDALTLYANSTSFERISLPNSTNLLSKTENMEDIDRDELKKALKSLLKKIK